MDSPLTLAVGDGVTDDTAAINAAILAGNPCNRGCVSLSRKVKSRARVF